MKLTLAEAAMGAGAVLDVLPAISNPGAIVVQGYSIDSRTIASGELFFAVKGERFDGHDFVPAAVDRGASAAVVSRARVGSLSNLAASLPLLVVDDPLTALQALGAHVRRQWGRHVIAVTGSAGKTTTKDAIAAALGAKFNVLKSKGNLNNHYGLPLQLLRIEPEHDFAVVELGMNHMGEIGALARIATPDWGVVTNVGMAHVENFADGQAGIARAKFELVESLPASGIAFLNCDDPYVSQFGRDFAGRAVYFGRGPCADPQILDVAEDASGLRIDYRADNEDRQLDLKLIGGHNALNAMAALAVARVAGVDLAAAAAALTMLTPGDKRGETISLAGATILNDAYNSNPEALRSMIRSLAVRPARRRILIAGEMLELGDHAPRLHAECGSAAAQAGIDFVVGVRGNAQHIAAAACGAGVASVFLPDAEAAGRWLAENLRTGDVVLVKGSRGVRLERSIETAKQLLSEGTPHE
jgi:UDP-N-acetylmuramoyl-tripeptide--D-alanyl-D-alanine ligase